MIYQSFDDKHECEPSMKTPAKDNGRSNKKKKVMNSSKKSPLKSSKKSPLKSQKKCTTNLNSPDKENLTSVSSNNQLKTGRRSRGDRTSSRNTICNTSKISHSRHSYSKLSILDTTNVAQYNTNIDTTVRAQVNSNLDKFDNFDDKSTPSITPKHIKDVQRAIF